MARLRNHLAAPNLIGGRRMKLRSLNAISYLSLATLPDVDIYFYYALESYVYCIHIVVVVELSKNQFFLLLVIIFILPFVLTKTWWLSNSIRATGEMRFTGHGNLGSVLGISTYPVLRFLKDKDTFYFNGNVNLDIKPEEKVMIRYQKDDPSDALVDNFVCIWMETISYAILPVLVLLILYIMPDRLDPIVPRGSVVVIGKKSFIKIVKKNKRDGSIILKAYLDPSLRSG